MLLGSGEEPGCLNGWGHEQDVSVGRDLTGTEVAGGRQALSGAVPVQDSGSGHYLAPNCLKPAGSRTC